MIDGHENYVYRSRSSNGGANITPDSVSPDFGFNFFTVEIGCLKASKNDILDVSLTNVGLPIILKS